MSVMLTIPTTTEVSNAEPGIEIGGAVFAFRAWGVGIELRVPDALLALLPSPIVPGAVADYSGLADAVLSVQVNPAVEGAPHYEVFEDGTLLARETSLQSAACMVESRVQLTVAALAKGPIFVHAGVVGWRDKAIVIPGRSFSGKSTLVMAFAEAGADYYSDEYALFDADGKIHPYWRQPKLRSASGRIVAGRLRNNIILEGPPPAPISLGWVLMSRYEAKSSWQPRRLTCGETMLGLLDNTVPIRSRPEESVRRLAKAVVNAQGFEGPRGEAADMARQILALL